MTGSRQGAGSPDSPREQARETALRRPAVPLALLALYLIWGSTYLAIRIAVETVPPFLMSGARFLVAGIVLFVFLRVRGAPVPTLRQWMGAGMVGALLLAGGNGLVGFAEQDVASGLAALLIATVPIWSALFARLWGVGTNRLEVAGLLLGLAGVGLLNLGSGLQGHPLAALVLLLAACSWAFGSVWSRHLPLPPGMMASATEMLVGGALMVAVGVVRGEHLPAAPSAASLWAMLYLVAVGSLIAYSAYTYLLRTVRPALATSYAYVNPVVAILLGALLAGERVTPLEVVALAVILAAVALVILGRERVGSPTLTR
ncbi:MAG TPA: drug/metabolite exporter YedA [Chloroflexota bacterium]|nr:drug/metabolite exporter YedA [Chloroflexota bacterium]